MYFSVSTEMILWLLSLILWIRVYYADFQMLIQCVFLGGPSLPGSHGVVSCGSLQAEWNCGGLNPSFLVFEGTLPASCKEHLWLALKKTVT